MCCGELEVFRTPNLKRGADTNKILAEVLRDCLSKWIKTQKMVDDSFGCHVLKIECCKLRILHDVQRVP